MFFQPKPKKRRLWSHEKEEALKVSLNMIVTPTIDECLEFLKANTDDDLFINRTPKEMQDKCRTIIKKHRIELLFSNYYYHYYCMYALLTTINVILSV